MKLYRIQPEIPLIMNQKVPQQRFAKNEILQFCMAPRVHTRDGFLVNRADYSVRIITYYADLFKRLDTAVYGGLKTENKRHKIKLLLDQVRPSALKSVIEKRVKVEAGLENVKLFISRPKEDANAFQAFGQQVGALESSASIPAGTALGNWTYQ